MSSAGDHRISVIIPVFNDAEFLRVCLEALARQTRLPNEVIVVDNNSVDASAAVARSFGARVLAEPVQGIAPASATGFDAATGDLIARLDADSIPPDDWLERLEKLAVSAGPLTVITGPGVFYGSSKFVATLGTRFYLGTFFTAFRLLLGHYPVFGSNFMMSCELWMRVRGSVHRIAGPIHDDIDLSYQLQPDMSVFFAPSVAVAISGRPFASYQSLLRRMRWVDSTMRLNFGDLNPFTRRRRRGRWLRAAAKVRRGH
jgi:glycosyltransferase involved in cell wall biosynthesis